MNTSSELDRIVGNWLESRVVDPSSGSLRSALARAGATAQQRHRWLPPWSGRRRGLGDRAASWARMRPSRDDGDRITSGVTIAAGVLAVLALAAVLILPQASPETDPAPAGLTYSVTADGSGDFATISAAVAAAEEGATVLIEPGTYVDAFIIDKDITLAGNGDTPPDVVITVPADAPAAVRSLAPYARRHDGYALPERPPVGIQVIETEATVRNLQVTGHRDAIDMLVVGGAPSLEDLVLNHRGSIESNASLAGGLFVEGGSSATVRDSAIWYRSRIAGGSDPTFTGSTFDRAQLTIQDGSAPRIADGIIRGDCGDDTVAVVGDSSPVFRGNLFTSAELDVRGAAGEQAMVTIEDNSFSFSDLVAVTIADDAVATITGNSLTGNTQAVSVSHATATIRDNTFVNNINAVTLSGAEGEVSGNTVRGGDYGLSVVSGGAPVITGNTIENATARGILVAGGTSPSISGNTVCGSAVNLYVQPNADPAIGDNDLCADEEAATG